MNLCFDFDGPIVDIRDRYYRAYLESLAGTSINQNQILSKENFWTLKQNRISDLEVGLLSGLSVNEAARSAESRKGLTFKQEYLQLDKLFEDVYKTFESLKRQNIVFFIVTLRRKTQLQAAVKQFKLDKYLNHEMMFALNDDQKVINDTQDKYIEIVNAINKLHLNPLDVWVIGDTDTDIHAGRLARCAKVIAICRGIRSRQQLELLKPDGIIANLTELTQMIEQLKVTS